MDPELFREVGQALYGPTWQSAIAADLQVADRTIRGWLAGRTKIPRSVAGDLVQLLRERRDQSMAIEARLAQLLAAA